MANAPAKKYRIGFVTATIWKNDGQERPFYTIDFQRTYRDSSGALKNTTTMNVDDLMNVAKLSEWALQWIAEQ